MWKEINARLRALLAEVEAKLEHLTASKTMLHANSAASTAPEIPDYVTLLQAAAMVKKSKKTLELRKTKRTLPPPAVEGGGGRADLYDWAVMRTWLADEFNFPLDRLPEVHPDTVAARARSSADRRNRPIANRKPP
jgi:hypothetical protein